jgi:hypothetical protein
VLQPVAQSSCFSNSAVLSLAEAAESLRGEILHLYLRASCDLSAGSALRAAVSGDGGGQREIAWRSRVEPALEVSEQWLLTREECGETSVVSTRNLDNALAVAGAGVIWNGDPLDPPVIPAKAGIQSDDSTFPKVCRVDSSRHGGTGMTRSRE